MSNVDGAAAPGTTPATPAAPPAGAPPAAGAPPSPPPPAAGTTLAGTPPDQMHADGGAAVPYWPTDWRDRLAKGDDGRKNLLSRYADPDALVEKIINQEEVIRRRPAAPPPKPGPDATVEEKQAWYKQVGLPAEPSGYMEGLQLSEGKVLGEADMPVANHFFNRMHEIGASKEVVSAAVDSVLEYMEEEQSNTIAEDERFRRDARDHLRDEWQQDYKRNMSYIAPAFGGNNDLRGTILSSRAPDGRLIGDHPEVIRWLVDMGKAIDPEASIGSGGPLTLQTVEAELDQLRVMMKDDAGPYYRGPMAEKHQTRFKDLLDQRDRIQTRQARNNRQ